MPVHTFRSIAVFKLTSKLSLISLYLICNPIASAQSTNKLSVPITTLTITESPNLSSKKTKQQENFAISKPECLTEVTHSVKCSNHDKINKQSDPILYLPTTTSFLKLLVQIPPAIPSEIIEPNRPKNQQLPEALPEKESTPTLLTPSLDSPQLVPFQPNSLSEEKIPVKKVEVLGSTAFSSKELEQVVAPFINKTLTFKELLVIRTALTELYATKGYETSGAFLPPQDTSNGIVKIQVVEGKLEDVKIQGLKHLRESYVRSRFGINANTPLSFQKLENVLQLLQLDPLFSKVQAELTVGTAPGRNILVLNLEEAQPLSSAVVVENRDSPSVGSTGVTGVFGYNNLLGLGDRLNAEVGYTEGVRSYNVNYGIPINSRNGTFSLRYNNGRNSVIEEPFTPLDIRGRSQTYSLGFYQPISLTPNNEFALGLSADLRRSETFLFEDEPFSFSEGTEDGESRVTALRFSQNWVNRNQNRVLAARSQFSFGLGVLGATVNNTGTDGRFFSWLGQFQWVQALNERKDTVFVTRVAAQLTPDSLLPLEQFSIGGVDTVRGYRQNQRIGDNGIVGSAEIRIPVVRDPDGFGLIQLAPFIDAGTIWSIRNGDSSTLVGTGLGLRWQLGSLSAQLDWGIPLIDVERQGNSLQDNGLYFLVRWQPF